MNQSSRVARTRRAEDLFVPCLLSKTSISSNFTPGWRTRRTAATSIKAPTARVYGVSSAPP